MSDRSKTFCPLPFTSVTVTATGRWALCCSSYADYSFPGGYKKIGDTNNIKEWFHSDYMNQVRQAMLEGKPLKECKSCYLHESAGAESLRQYLNATSQTKIDTDNLEIKEVDIKFGNKCNLRCKMCFPHASSELMKEWRQLGWDLNDPMEDVRGDYYKNYITENYNWPSDQKNLTKLFELVKTIKILKFTGGEPMINPAFLRFLKFCVDSGVSKSIVLDLATNCTKIHPSFLRLAQQFQRVEIRLSIDGTDQTYNYVRYPGNWTQTFENLKTYSNWFREKKLHGNLQINFVLSIFNLGNVADSFEQLNTYVDHFYITNLFKPAFMTWNHAPKHIQRQALASAVKLSYAKDSVRQTVGSRLIQFYQRPLIESTAQSHAQLKAFVQSQDNLRGININDYLPDYGKFLD
jgi:sulfatase maturation enzyme AslB (radical SAM superfamily)